MTVYGPDITPDLGDLDIDFAALSARGASQAWTPAFSVQTGLTGAWTYSLQTGLFTQNGKQCIAEFNLAWTAKPSAGQIVVVSLPVPSVSVNKGFVSVFSGVTLTNRSGHAGSQLALAGFSSVAASLAISGSGLASTDDPRIDVSAMAAAGSLQGVIVFNTV